MWGKPASHRKQRFKQHKKGGPGTSSEARNYGMWLRKSLYKDAPVCHTRADAERAEGDWADKLRADGYRVWEGRLGPISIPRKSKSKGAT